MVVEYLEGKVDEASITASDEYMYQDKGEAQQELKTAANSRRMFRYRFDRRISSTGPGTHYHMSVTGVKKIGIRGKKSLLMTETGDRA